MGLKEMFNKAATLGGGNGSAGPPDPWDHGESAAGQEAPPGYKGLAYPEDPPDELSAFIRAGDVKRVRTLFNEGFWQADDLSVRWTDLRHCFLTRDFDMARMLVMYGAQPTPEELGIHLHFMSADDKSLKEEITFMARCGLPVSPKLLRSLDSLMEVLSQGDVALVQNSMQAIEAALPESHPVCAGLRGKLGELEFVDPAKLIRNGEFHAAVDMLEKDILGAGKVDMRSVMDIWYKTLDLPEARDIHDSIHKMLRSMVQLGVEVTGLDASDSRLSKAPAIACDLIEMGFCKVHDFDLKTVVRNWYEAGADAKDYAEYKSLAAKIARKTGACVPDLDGKGTIAGHHVLGKLTVAGRAAFAIDLIETGAVAVTHHDLSDVNKALTHGDVSDRAAAQRLHDLIFDDVKARMRGIEPKRSTPPEDEKIKKMMLDEYARLREKEKYHSWKMNNHAKEFRKEDYYKDRYEKETYKDIMNKKSKSPKPGY